MSATTSTPQGSRAALTRKNPVLWLLMGAVVLAGIVVGWSATETTGSSEDRKFAIAEEMRCLQCSGESVSKSQAPLAIQMRGEIAQQVAKGKTDDEIYSFFVNRYGERVLLNPSGQGITGLVWIIPVVVIGAGLAALGLMFARRGRGQTIDASAEDRALVEHARSRAE